MKEYDFNARRTVRKYSDRDVSREELDSILETAMRAPTCGNMQLYSVVVTRSREGKEALAPLHFNQPMITGAPVVLTVCADFNRFTRWCEVSGAKPGYDNFLSFLSAVTDAVIYAQQICTVAESRGLGTCYLGTVVYNAGAISQLLNLPDLCVPVACITLGYPAEEGVETERLPLRAVVHEETYRNDSDSDIKEQHRAKEEYPANLRFVEENRKPSLAAVFTDIRYPENLNVSVSEALEKLLKAKKFVK